MDDDRALVADATRGNRDAFDELVVRYQVKLYNLARAMSGGSVDAEDVVQETFLRAFRSIGRFRGESSFKTWLYRIAMNVMRTHLEQRGRRIRLVFSGESSDGEASILDRAPSDLDLENDVALRDAIDRALLKLPEDLRTVLSLRDLQGLKYQEIADVMGIPVGTVESRLFRARQRLRPVLGELLGRTRRKGADRASAVRPAIASVEGNSR